LIKAYALKTSSSVFNTTLVLFIKNCILLYVFITHLSNNQPKLRNMKKSFLVILFFTSVHLFGQQVDPLTLWYDELSGDVWENALPIGNGHIGAMVYGNVTNEIFQLNESTIWSGSPNSNANPNALEALSKVRKLIFDKQFKAAENLANEKIITKKSH